MTVSGFHSSLQLILKYLPSPKNSIIAENCLPGNDSTEWDVNADGDPSIQVNIYLLLENFYDLNAFHRALPQNSVLSRERLSSSRSRLIPRTTDWISSALDGMLPSRTVKKTSSGMGVLEPGKWERSILFLHFNFPRYHEVTD